MSDTGRAIVLTSACRPLHVEVRPVPRPSSGQVMIRVGACAVCRTDLHIVDGELSDPKLPLVLGHQVVGRVEEVGPDVSGWRPGDRVGVPWLGWTCGACAYCRAGRENLCDEARFTGYNLDGGFAEHLVAHAAYCVPLGEDGEDHEAAPLLCAGLIGSRALEAAGPAERLGLYGFGSSAHLVAQVALAQGREVFAFTRPGDTEAQRFATSLGARWAGGSSETPPEELDAAILFAPAGELVPLALAAVRKGGTVVCAGIHMSDIPRFPYHLLWGERIVRSVANLTRRDAERFFAFVAEHPIETRTVRYPLEDANRALDDLRAGRTAGTAVLDCLG